MITGQQCKMARAALGMEVKQLSEETRIAPSTIWKSLQKKGGVPHPSTVMAIQRFFESRGVEFVDGGVIISKKARAEARMTRCAGACGRSTDNPQRDDWVPTSDDSYACTACSGSEDDAAADPTSVHESGGRWVGKSQHDYGDVADEGYTPDDDRDHH